MPTYSDAPLPVELDALVGMGMNRVKLAIVVALSRHGGSLSTPDLVGALEGQVAGTTIVRNLHELEDHGYVIGDPSRGDRRRRLTRWSLNHGAPRRPTGAHPGHDPGGRSSDTVRLNCTPAPSRQADGNRELGNAWREVAGTKNPLSVTPSPQAMRARRRAGDPR